MTLDEAPPGLFWYHGCLGVKTEYWTESRSHAGVWLCDAYVVKSGEYFWGGTSDPRDRGKLSVCPIEYCKAKKSLPMLTIHDVREMLERLVGEAGSITKLAAARNVSRSYISDVMHGRREPGPQLLKAFGLRRIGRVTMYKLEADET